MAISKIITTGVYGFNETNFFKALVDANVDTFCDVRLRRGVRGSQYAFVNSSRLQNKLTELRISYVHCLDLAPSKEIRLKQKQADQLENILKRDRTTLSESFIRAYTDQCLNNFDFRTFIQSLENSSVIALFCVEKQPHACHRSLVSEKLHQEFGIEVEHLEP